jgi:integrase/recombinase XerC
VSELTGSSAATILAAAAKLRENAITDQTYRETPIGLLVGRYLDELRFENYSPATLKERERLLVRFALDFAHRELAEITTDDLRAWLAEWKDAAPNTRAAYVSTIRVFFSWAHERDHIPLDPAAKRLKSPRSKATERRSHAQDTIRQLVLAQNSRRDRVALLLMYWCALRRNELRLVQFRHINLANRVLTVFGKGGTILEQNIPEAVAIELERHILDRRAEPDEYLLHPQRVGRFGSWPLYTEGIVWEDRFRPLSLSGIDKWWQRCVAASGLAHFPMHELRHSAGTHFHETGHDLVATQHFMRHRNPATTAKTYIHLDRARAISEVQRRMPDPLADE